MTAVSLRDEQTAMTRDRILSALAELLHEEQPAAISMHAVAVQAGVSDRTVYRHFRTKQELFAALPQWVTDQIERDFTPSKAKSPHDVIANLARSFPALDRMRVPYQAISTFPEAAEELAKQHGVRRRDITRAMAPVTKGLSKADATKVTAIAHLLSSSRALYFLQEVWWLSVDEAVDACQWAVAAVVKEARA